MHGFEGLDADPPPLLSVHASATEALVWSRVPRRDLETSHFLGGRVKDPELRVEGFGVRDALARPPALLGAVVPSFRSALPAEPCQFTWARH